MMYSAYKLNKQDDNIQPWCTPFPIWSQSVVPCPVLTVASWPAYRFLKRQVRWSGIPISFRIFQFIVIHTNFRATESLLWSLKTILKFFFAFKNFFFWETQKRNHWKIDVLITEKLFLAHSRVVFLHLKLSSQCCLTNRLLQSLSFCAAWIPGTQFIHSLRLLPERLIRLAQSDFLLFIHDRRWWKNRTSSKLLPSHVLKGQFLVTFCATIEPKFTWGGYTSFSVEIYWVY